MSSKARSITNGTWTGSKRLDHCSCSSVTESYSTCPVCRLADARVCLGHTENDVRQAISASGQVQHNLDKIRTATSQIRHHIAATQEQTNQEQVRFDKANRRALRLKAAADKVRSQGYAV